MQGTIINLTISQFSGKRKDRKATNTVNEEYGSTNSGNFLKFLFDPQSLKPISKVATQMRTFHRKNTLNYDDNGDRFLPNKNYFKYLEGYNQLVDEFEFEVRAFISKYEDNIQSSKDRLAGIFNPGDYPTKTELEEKFGVVMAMKPVQSDSAVAELKMGGVPKAEVEKVKRQMIEAQKERAKKPTEDMLSRAKDVLEKLIFRMAEAEPKFRKSIIGNVEDLINTLPVLNFNNDPSIDKLINDMRGLLVDHEALKGSPELRLNTMRKAESIIKSIS